MLTIYGVPLIISFGFSERRDCETIEWQLSTLNQTLAGRHSDHCFARLLTHFLSLFLYLRYSDLVVSTFSVGHSGIASSIKVVMLKSSCSTTGTSDTTGDQTSRGAQISRVNSVQATQVASAEHYALDVSLVPVIDTIDCRLKAEQSGCCCSENRLEKFLFTSDSPYCNVTAQ